MSDPFAIPNRETVIALYDVADASMKLLGFLRGWAADPKGMGKRWRTDVLAAVWELGQSLDTLEHFRQGGGTKETGT